MIRESCLIVLGGLKMDTYRKTIFVILSCFLILTCLPCDNSASFISDDIPTGKEIKDPYLEQLFAPEFLFESVKVIETKEGKRFIVIKAKKSISKEAEKEYQSKTLRQRNISIRRIYNPHTGALMIAELKLVRKVSDVPYVVEYYMAVKEANKDVAWRDGKYFVIAINKDFGKKFKKLTIYPEKEVDCPAPPYVGKYPNAIALGCHKEKSQIIFTYVTKDEPQKIYDFYKCRLKKHFDDIGLYSPETHWDTPVWGSGIRIDYSGIEVIDGLLKGIKEKALLPPKGVVFKIVITRVASDAEALVQGYSWIEVHYETDQSKIKEYIKWNNGLRR